MRITTVLLAASMLVLPGCFGTPAGWHKKGVPQVQVDIDVDNCSWDATHKPNEDGSYSIIDLTSDQEDASVKSCMENKGYKWGVPEETDED